MPANKTSAVVPVLRTADPVIKAFVAALKKENAKLQRQVGTLEAKLLSAEHRIAALKKCSSNLAPRNLDEVRAEFKKLEHELGYDKLRARIAELEEELQLHKPPPNL